MLANLLPGFRQVRTPFVVGILYIATVYLGLGVGPFLDVLGGKEGRLIERIVALTGIVGAATILGAVVLVATLLGSLLTLTEWPKGLRVTRRSHGELIPARHLMNASDWALKLLRDRAPLVQMPEMPRHFTSSYMGVVEAFVEQHAIYAFDPDHRHANWRPRGDLGHWWWECLSYPAAFYAMTSERRALENQLRVVGGLLFDEYDRYRSEAELRYSVTPPLVLLTATVSYLADDWHLLGLLAFPLVIVLAGRRAEKRSLSILGSALRQGVVRSQLEDMFAAAVGREGEGNNISAGPRHFLTNDVIEAWTSPGEFRGDRATILDLESGESHHVVVPSLTARMGVRGQIYGALRVMKVYGRW